MNPSQQGEPAVSNTPTQVPATAVTDYRSVLKSAKKDGDVLVLLITLIFTVLGIFMLFEGTPTDIFVTVIILLVISLVYVRLEQIKFMNNALRVQNGRHAYLLNIVQEISNNLQMPTVDVYITQDPYLNAFAMGYVRPYSIVLHSAVVEEMTPEEVKAILIHEMAHVKYKHTIISTYVNPLGALVPILGDAVKWLFGFWSRRTELTCDRLALAYTRDPHTLIMALIKIHVGSRFAEYMAEEGVLYQEKIGKGFTKHLSQSLSTHPFLVTRVHEVLDFAQKLGLQTQGSTPVPSTYQVQTQQPAQK